MTLIMFFYRLFHLLFFGELPSVGMLLAYNYLLVQPTVYGRPYMASSNLLEYGGNSYTASFFPLVSALTSMSTSTVKRVLYWVLPTILVMMQTPDPW